jgi:hypothetical protein
LSPRRSKDEVARDLIRWHFFADPSLSKIYRILTGQEDRDDEPIKLLEVSSESSETGQIDAFLFTPKDEIEYWSLIAEVTPNELELVKMRKLDLPEGWSLGDAQCFEREEFEK